MVSFNTKAFSRAAWVGAIGLAVAGGMMMEGCGRRTVVRSDPGEDVVIARGPAAQRMAESTKAPGVVVAEPRREVIVTEPRREVIVTEPRTEVVERTIVVREPIDPPPLRVETRPLAPSSDLVWVPGSWEWVDGQWQWSAGHWAQPIRPAAVWEPGRWVAVPGGYAWQPGHWR
jgi:hypothetical protein